MPRRKRESDLAKDIGWRIYNARIYRGMSQTDLCKALDNGMARTMVSTWENGRHIPGTETIVALCTALKVTPNYLFGWEDLSDVD